MAYLMRTIADGRAEIREKGVVIYRGPADMAQRRYAFLCAMRLKAQGGIAAFVADHPGTAARLILDYCKR